MYVLVLRILFRNYYQDAVYLDNVSVRVQSRWHDSVGVRELLIFLQIVNLFPGCIFGTEQCVLLYILSDLEKLRYDTFLICKVAV